MCLRGARRVFPSPLYFSGTHSGGSCNSTCIVSLQPYIHSEPCNEYCLSTTTNMLLEGLLGKKKKKTTILSDTTVLSDMQHTTKSGVCEYDQLTNSLNSTDKISDSTSTIYKVIRTATNIIMKNEFWGNILYLKIACGHGR